MKIQITLFHKDNKYKPMSTILEVESMEYYEEHKAELQKKAMLNIGHQRYLTPQEIIKNGFTKGLILIFLMVKCTKWRAYQTLIMAFTITINVKSAKYIT